MKKNTMLTIVLSICGAIVIGCGAYFAYRGFKPKSDGSITVEVVDLNDVLVKQKTIEYMSGDSLVSLVSENFDNVTIQDGMILSIETLTTPTDWSTYICIYQNGEMSNFGINEIKFDNGDTISFVNTVFDWNEW